MQTKKNDLGFVELVESMGDALSIVNAARISFGRSQAGELTEKDKRLIKYLWRNKHTSPFRHVCFKFHIKAPIFILRQWMKHQVGCSWNEISGRYVKFDPSFYEPEKFRIQSTKVKQGSGGPIENQLNACSIYNDSINQSYSAYERLLEAGVCREQARTVLPLSLFSQCYWTASLHAVIHFLNLRLKKDAQLEIRLYAEAVREILEKQVGMDFVLKVCLDEL